MPTTKTGVFYRVAASGPAENVTGRSEHWTKGSNQTHEVLHLAWDDWSVGQFRADMLGSSQWFPMIGQSIGGVTMPNSGYFLSRTLPETHPVYTWMPCVELELIGVIGTPLTNGNIGQFMPLPAPPGQSAQEEFGTDAIAVVGATYRAVLYNCTRDDDYIAQHFTFASAGELNRYVEKDREGKVQNLAVEGSYWQFHDRPDITFMDQSRQGGVLRKYSFGNWKYLWREVPSIPDQFGNPTLPPQLLANWAACEGCINSQQFDSHNSLTLLCGAVQYHRIVSPTGAIQYDVEIPMSEMNVPFGWISKFRNYDQFNIDNPNFYQVDGVMVDRNGVTHVQQPYASVDFSQRLFFAI